MGLGGTPDNDYIAHCGSDDDDDDDVEEMVRHLDQCQVVSGVMHDCLL